MVLIVEKEEERVRRWSGEVGERREGWAGLVQGTSQPRRRTEIVQALVGYRG